MSSAPSSADDALTAALASVADQVVALLGRVSVPAPVVLIDGRSGAGKSSLVPLLLERWQTSRPVQCVALDSIYPGWDGLAAGAAAATAGILAPHLRGDVGIWHRWDWERSERAEAHTVDPAAPVVLEGCGSITKTSALLSNVRVWLDAPAAERKRRALARDGAAYAPFWERWAAQEEQHIRQHGPAGLADISVMLP